MTLDEKLEQLGYKYERKKLYWQYVKYYYDIEVGVCIQFAPGFGITDYGVYSDGLFLYKQKHIDNMQIAFNRLQEDLKKLQEFGLNVEEEI